MSAGKSFGKFVAEGLLPGQSRRVYLAHQRSSEEFGAYVVKVVSVAETGAADIGGTARRLLDGVSLQDRVAQDWHDVVAPVVERPTKAAEVVATLNSGEVWYVTRRYAGSLREVLEALGGNSSSAANIWTICRAVARGALAFKQVDAPTGGRRSHGNLKLGNILFSDLALTEGKTEIVVSDPAPVLAEGPEAEPARIEEQFERADLLALGKVLFQLVAGRCLPENWNWEAVWSSPESDIVRWRQVFNRAAGAWRTLCQELLEAGAGRGPASLADVEHRLGAMQPKVSKPILPKVLAVAAVLVVTGIVAAAVTLWQMRGFIIVQVADTPELTADVTVRNRNVPADTQTLPLVNGTVEFKAKAGHSYDVELKPTGAYARVPAPVIPRQNVKPHSRNPIEVTLVFATLEVSARGEGNQPVAAGVLLGKETNAVALPATLHVPVVTNLAYRLYVVPNDGGWESAELTLLLDSAGKRVTTNVVLTAADPGAARVWFRADARLPLNFQLGTNEFRLGRDDVGYRKSLTFQRGDAVAVRLQPPPPWPAVTTNWTVPDADTVDFPTDFLRADTLVRLLVTNSPPDAELLVARPGAASQVLGTLSEQREMLFPPEDLAYRFELRRPGYRGWTNPAVTIRSGTTNLVGIPDLLPEYGFLELTANLPGFEVYTNRVLVRAAGGSNTTVYLPPFTQHELLVVYSNDFGILRPTNLTTRVNPGETNRQRVSFDFVQIEIEPDPTNATVYRVASSGQAVPLRARKFLQPPGMSNMFRVEAEHYELWEQNLGSPSLGLAVLKSAPLKARKYPVYLEVSPPDAVLSAQGDRLGFARNATNFLEFGSYTAVANDLMLGSVTNTFTINPSTMVTQRWVLPAGTVSVETGQEGLEVRIFPENNPALAAMYEQYGNAWLRAGQSQELRTQIRDANLPPGDYRLIFSDGGERATNRIQVVLNARREFKFPEVVFLPPAYTNSLGMPFTKVKGESAYISLLPVNRSDFNKILDPTGQHPVVRGESAAVTDELPDNAGSKGTLPQASLNNMLEFCRLMTQQESTRLGDQLRGGTWQYELPQLADWQSGAADPGFKVPTIADANDSTRTVPLPELVLRDGRYYHADKGTNRLINVGPASLRQGRQDLGFRVVVRRKSSSR